MVLACRVFHLLWSGELYGKLFPLVGANSNPVLSPWQCFKNNSCHEWHDLSLLTLTSDLLCRLLQLQILATVLEDFKWLKGKKNKERKEIQPSRWPHDAEQVCSWRCFHRPGRGWWQTKVECCRTFWEEDQAKEKNELYHGDSIDQVEVNKQTHKISEL